MKKEQHFIITDELIDECLEASIEKAVNFKVQKKTRHESSK